MVVEVCLSFFFLRRGFWCEYIIYLIDQKRYPKLFFHVLLVWEPSQKL